MSLNYAVLLQEASNFITMHAHNSAKVAPNGENKNLLKPPGSYLDHMHEACMDGGTSSHELVPRLPSSNDNPRDKKSLCFTCAKIEQPHQPKWSHLQTNNRQPLHPRIRTYNSLPSTQATRVTHPKLPCTCKTNFLTTYYWR